MQAMNRRESRKRSGGSKRGNRNCHMRGYGSIIDGAPEREGRGQGGQTRGHQCGQGGNTNSNRARHGSCANGKKDQEGKKSRSSSTVESLEQALSKMKKRLDKLEGKR